MIGISKRLVKSSFSQRAAEWAACYSDIEPQTLEAQNLTSRQRLALAMLETAVPRPAKVLDLGCGTGDTAALLLRRGYEVWGLDIAEPMIRYARDRCRSDQFWIGDVEHIPFADNTFDAVVSLGVIEYQETDGQVLGEIWRILKPGGKAVISTPSAACPLYQLDRAFAALETATRPLYHLVKYRLRGRRPPEYQPSPGIATRKYYRGRWLRFLRSAGMEPEEWICHGWGWYSSRLGLLAEFLSRKAKLLRPNLERFFGPARICRASDRFVRNRALNWLASEQLVRLRAVKNDEPFGRERHVVSARPVVPPPISQI